MILIALTLLFSPMFVFAWENIDPDRDDSQYAYEKNISWLKAEKLI